MRSSTSGATRSRATWSAPNRPARRPSRSSPTTGSSSRTPGRSPTRIIEEARKTADQLRADIQARAEREAAATVAKAQEEIRAERDRVFQELRGEIGEIAVELAERVVGASLDAKSHQRLIDEYIDQVASGVSGNGKH